MRRDSAISTQDALTLLAVLASSSTLVGTAPRQADFCSSGLRILKRLLLRLAFVACVSISSLAFAQSPAPNILIILADDLGYGDVSYNGCPDYATPNIDSLATNGVWCSSGYVTHPFCSPSRAALITGRYQQRFGHAARSPSTLASRGARMHAARCPGPSSMSGGSTS